MTSTKDETATAATARVYIRAGWSVFPLWWAAGPATCACPDGAACSSPGKHPLSVKVGPGRYAGAPHGVKDATLDPVMVAAWWTRWPDANIGLPAGDNGLAILDIDPDKGGTDSLTRLHGWLSRRGHRIPNTLAQETGSGGWHLVFRAPDGGIKSGSKVFGPDMPGLDTRGRGGYIVAAPSLHGSGRRYAWSDWLGTPEAPWPHILTQLMDPPKAIAAAPAGARPAGQVVAADTYSRVAFDGELDRIRSTAEGSRNAVLNRSAFSLGQLVAARLLDRDAVERELHAAALAIGLTDTEARKTIRSGLRSGAQHPRTLDRVS